MPDTDRGNKFCIDHQQKLWIKTRHYLPFSCLILPTSVIDWTTFNYRVRKKIISLLLRTHARSFQDQICSVVHCFQIYFESVSVHKDNTADWFSLFSHLSAHQSTVIVWRLQLLISYVYLLIRFRHVNYWKSCLKFTNVLS